MTHAPIYLLRRDARFRLAQIGQCFGIGYPAVSPARTRAEKLRQKDKPLLRRLKMTL